MTHNDHGHPCLLTNSKLILPGLLLILASLSAFSANSIPGTASLSGTVTAAKPFTVAKVYARNRDRNMVYTVYAISGHYRAVSVLPGSYQVWAEREGFKSKPTDLEVKPDSNLKADLALNPAGADTAVGTTAAAEAWIRGVAVGRGEAAGNEIQLLPYDKLYPPDPVRKLVERTCMVCHMTDFLPSQHMSAEQWHAAIGRMMDSTQPQGAQIQPGSSVGVLSQEERQAVAAYLAKNFGPESSPRALKRDVDIPVDAQALSKAMFIEYFLPVNPGYKNRAQDPKIDNDGNVWYTGQNRLGKLDPLTGQFTDYPLPERSISPHGLTIDSKGYVFWAESTGGHLGRLDPSTGKMDRFPTGVPAAHMNTPILDSKENVWFTFILGNYIGKWDRKTEQIKVWEVPTPNSFPYGIVRSSDDKIWFAEYHGGKVAKFDPVTEHFTEYPAKTQPALVRRLGIDARDTVWFGVWNRGKLDRLDTKTGELVEYDILAHTEPYDSFPDPDGQVWVSDGGLGGTLIKFDPITKKSTFFPTPRRTDIPKLDVTREGAIWYTTRSSPVVAIGVLYPDMTKMRSYAATRWK